MTAHVLRTPPKDGLRRGNFLLGIEREGRDAYQAGLSHQVCKYSGIERRAWLTGYEQAARNQRNHG